MEGVDQHLSLLQADSEAEVLGCIREAVYDVLYGFLHVREKGTVVSKQRLSGEFLDGLRSCEETSKVEEMGLLFTLYMINASLGIANNQHDYRITIK